MFAVLVLSIVFMFSEPGMAEAVQNITNDSFAWLEEIYGKKSLEWVNDNNTKTLQALENLPYYQSNYKTSLDLLTDEERIPYGEIRGGYYYNFWQDKKQVRGIWRRMALEQFLNGKRKWQILLDVDQLADSEKENWQFKGAECLAPDYRYCLVGLSRGGKDAKIFREFDVETRKFVKDGFFVDEAKSRVTWLDQDRIAVATDYGKDSLTEAGYPRLIKVWQRNEAKTIPLFEGAFSDEFVVPYRWLDQKTAYNFIIRYVSFHQTEKYIFSDGLKVNKLLLPNDSEVVGLFSGRLLLHLQTEWTLENKTLPSGSLVAFMLRGANPLHEKVELIYSPSVNSAFVGVIETQGCLYVNELHNVRPRLLRYALVGKDGEAVWSKQVIDGKGFESGSLGIVGASLRDDKALFSYSGFLKPSQLLLIKDKKGKLKKVRGLGQKFNTKNMVTKQFIATSQDGTKIPYSLVYKTSKKLPRNRPTILYAYGGFAIPVLPNYGPIRGKLWLEKDGLYVVAHIRGGGEFGPGWHHSVLRTNRHKAFEDFIAVAEDLIARKLTTRKQLSIMGGSNGGLLVGAAMTQRPDLFHSVVCLVPLLDMFRYMHLLAGASWEEEYGDPEKDESIAKFWRQYSPYQQLKAGVTYPEVFFLTSTADDRVHPGHARKMAAAMQALKSKVLYFENTEGGHAAGTNLKQHARKSALIYTYLQSRLFENFK